MAGYFQNKHPNPCRFSPVGYFGSKFVTVCVTGKSITYLFILTYIKIWVNRLCEMFH